MSKGLMFGVLALHLAAGLAAGQAAFAADGTPLPPPPVGAIGQPVVPGAPPPMDYGAPAPPVLPGPVDWQQPPPPPPPPLPPPPFSALHQLLGCLGPPSAGGAVCTAEADFVLWSVPDLKDNVRVATTSAAGGDVTAGGLSTFREEELNQHPVSGVRLGLGYWLLDPNPWLGGAVRACGAEARLFVVGSQVSSSLDASPTIVRPFFDLNDARNTAVVVAFPGVATGSFGVTATRNDLWGLEANCWKNVGYNYPGTFSNLDLMAGVRYLSLSQSLRFDRFSVFSANIPANSPFLFLAGDRITDFDSFGTHNRFLGSQVGLAGRVGVDGFSLETSLKLGLGCTEQVIKINGQQSRVLPDRTVINSPGGLLALPSNSGLFTKFKFSEVPEVSVTANFQLTSCLTLRAGLTSLYWHRVVSPGAEVDRTIDISQIPSFPGAATAGPVVQQRPGVPFTQSYLWLTGVTCGLEVAW